MSWHGRSETQSLKFFKTLNQYKNSTGTCMFYVESKRATSYGHWCFLKVIKGKLIFNDYHYSSSTSAHQSCVREVLKSLKIKIDFCVYQSETLDDGVQVRHLVERIELAKLKLSKKGLREKTRKHLESSLAESIKELKDIQKALKISVPRELLKQVKASVLKNENERLESNRRNNTKNPINADLKKELNSLDSISLLDKMNETDDLNSINPNQRN